MSVLVAAEVVSGMLVFRFMAVVVTVFGGVLGVVGEAAVVGEMGVIVVRKIGAEAIVVGDVAAVPRAADVEG